MPNARTLMPRIFADTERWPEADADPQSYLRRLPAHFFFGVERDAIGKHRLGEMQ